MTKDDLNILRDINKRSRRIKEAQERLRESVTDISSHISDMPRSQQHRDKMAEYMVKYTELEEQFRELDIEVNEKYLKVEREVSSLPLRQAEIITSKYRDGKSWRNICREQHISKSQAFRDYEAALIKLGVKPKKNNTKEKNA